MRKILRYNESIQKTLGCKTKPEPWMHIGIKTPSKRLPFVGYTIWVWDTRQVLEQNIEQDFGRATVDFVNRCNIALKQGQPAIDNHQPLKGGESIEYERPDLHHVDMSVNDVMEVDGDAGQSMSKAGLWQHLCKLANADPERTNTLYYCMANDFNMYVGGRPGERGYTGQTTVVPLGQYVKITSDMDDNQIKQLMKESKSGTVGYASRMQARYHGNPSCGRKGQYREIVGTSVPRSGYFYPI